MSPQPKVRLASNQDIEPLVSLYLQVAGRSPNKAFFNWDEGRVRDELLQAKTWIVEDNKIAAFVTFREYLDRFEISAIGTGSDFLKRGMAQIVLNALKKNAMQQNLPVWLEVHENNQTALNLYLKNDFKVINTRKRYYSDGGSAVVMCFEGS